MKRLTLIALVCVAAALVAIGGPVVPGVEVTLRVDRVGLAWGRREATSRAA